ncbi:MAG TPA: dTDP-4-dehydrorhamnose reductase [Steroidobacteraceae bacterium]|nr:dTDP-4-dehydrorhamnose reductase [Steroidobacteraceae bacterium]
MLVLGAGGQVGRAVAQTPRTGHQVIAKTRSEVNISDAPAVGRTLAESTPDWVVNAAAYTAVDLAEDEAQKAAAINDTAVGVIAAAAARAGCRVLHLSTDFIFDGTSSRAYLPGDAPRPLSVYGATKLAGERRLLEAGNGGIVLRTAWVYASAGRNFVLTMLRSMKEREQIRVVSDQIGAPTWATSLAGIIWGLIEAQAPAGTYHWTDLGVASWYDFAVAIQEEALARGLLSRPTEVVPIATADYPTRARRPAFSVLDTTVTRALSVAPAAHWRVNLRKMLDELRTA